MSRKGSPISGRWSTAAEIFGATGREEADELLVRRSGDADRPRMLGASTRRRRTAAIHVHIITPDGKMQCIRWRNPVRSAVAHCRSCEPRKRPNVRRRNASAAWCSAPMRGDAGRRHQRSLRYRQGPRARRRRLAGHPEEAELITRCRSTCRFGRSTNAANASLTAQGAPRDPVKDDHAARAIPIRVRKW